jgi:putative NADPH-quinone reductase
MPAIMKGYIDRVTRYELACRYDKNIQKGLLTGKYDILILVASIIPILNTKLYG